MPSPESAALAATRRLLGEAAASLTPDSVRELAGADEGIAWFCAAHLEGLRADGGTLWIVAEGESVLEAVVNPWEPELIGQRQSLETGLISTAFFLEHGIMENDVKSHPRHDLGIDAHTGRTTVALLATPVHVADALCGVWSCVRFTAAADPFLQADLDRHERAAACLGRILESGLVRHLLSSSR